MGLGAYLVAKLPFGNEQKQAPLRVKVCNLNPNNSCEAITNCGEQVASLLPQKWITGC